MEKFGFTAVRHQREVGTGYYDKLGEIISGGESSTSALKGSTEERFQEEKKEPEPPKAPEKTEKS